MVTHYTRWVALGDEREVKTHTAETLTEHPLTRTDAPLQLFAIGGTSENGFSHNWDIYAGRSGALYSVARPGTGARSTCFGDVKHIRRLIRDGRWNNTLTTYGRRMMEDKKP